MTSDGVVTSEVLAIGPETSMATNPRWSDPE
jgi:hypothetical protein